MNRNGKDDTAAEVAAQVFIGTWSAGGCVDPAVPGA